METLCMISFLLVSFISGSSGSNPGTPTNLKEIFIGRCWDLQHVIRPELFMDSNSIVDCNMLWQHFTDAFAYKPPCNTTAEDYRAFSKAASHPIPAHKSLFWESVYPFVNDFSQDGDRFTTIANTLLGYMADQVYWCGQEADPGINYDACPSSSECQNLNGQITSFSYWQMTSIYFAMETTGISYALMNGSFVPPFGPNSIFATRELVKLTPEQGVTDLRIMVLHDIGGPIHETCGEGSLLQLEDIARGQGLSVTCEDDPKSVRAFQCVDAPDAPECVFSREGSANDAPISRLHLYHTLIHVITVRILYNTW